MGEQDLAYFKLGGRIGRTVVSATWNHGYLTADEELLERADLLVASGETFTVEGSPRQLRAGLGEPVAAALTLIRSFDEVTDAKFALGSEDSDEAARIAVRIQSAPSEQVKGD